MIVKRKREERERGEGGEEGFAAFVASPYSLNLAGTNM
jgi:hypothetical protein